MTDKSLLIKDARLLDPGQSLDKVADVLITDGEIKWIGKGQTPANVETINAAGLILTPGFIDIHCHLREPGLEYKENISTGTRAAARGGFTTVCCMPNTSPPVDSKSLVEYVLRRAAAEAVIRVLPIGCISKAQQGKELAEMGGMASAGAVAFSDDGKPVANANLMRQALSYSLTLNMPIIDHCEDPALFEGGLMNESPTSYRLGLKGIPSAAEETMVGRDIALAALTGAHVHIAHISTAGSVDLVRNAKAKGVRVTAEVTPHHLLMTDDWVTGVRIIGGSSATANPYDTSTKVNPPLRAKSDAAALLEALKDGTIDCIATDHAPHDVVDKSQEYDHASFGISGIETAFGLLMALVHTGKLDIKTLVEKLTVAPAKVIGHGYKGIKAGAPAELTLLNPDEEWTVDVNSFLSKGKNSPLNGIILKGKVKATIYDGKIVYSDVNDAATAPRKKTNA
ncbi:MAG: dihydroorotase [Dehalococcoidia bacterium]|nr:dihydroorotase [Dehalococcoidia bacterium]